MTELERLQHIRNAFRDKALQYRVMADAEPNEHVAIGLRGTATGFEIAASDLTTALCGAVDDLWNAATAKLRQKDAA